MNNLTIMKNTTYKLSPAIKDTVIHRLRSGYTIRKDDIYGDFKAINIIRKNSRVKYMQLECVECSYTITKLPVASARFSCTKCKVANNILEVLEDNKLKQGGLKWFG